ncbi:MAG: hypothetical protein COA78_19690 [Blastopirellula sp.]|nr:MAG: hypothetical protein COA78_19690 [Blastopirellula sp.]
MQIDLKFGPTDHFSLDLSDEKVKNDFISTAKPADSVRLAVTNSLLSPVDFPKLSEATVPGDHLLITVDPELPSPVEAILGFLDYAQKDSLSDRQFTFLVPNTFTDDTVQALGLPESAPDLAVNIEKHDCEDRDQLVFLGTTKENHTVMVNRLIGDADMVIPLVYARNRETLGHFEAGQGLFPTFADKDTQLRYAGPTVVEQPVLHRRRNDEAAEVTRMIGVIFSIQCLPAPGHQISEVFSGDQFSLNKKVQAYQDEHWKFRAAARVPAVVLTLGDQPGQQTWDNIARALAMASRLVEDHGAVIVCTSLDDRPGGSIARLAGNDDMHEHFHRLRKDRNRDSFAALQLAHSIDQAKVYLRSNLPDSLIEDLNMVPVANEHELERICEYYDNCIILRDAQFVDAAITGESVTEVTDIESMK